MEACSQCGTTSPAGFRFCGSCGAPLDSGQRGVAARKQVTVLFSDVVDSTPLTERVDAETLRNVMSRYFEHARSTLERHGGTVEKFIGDAVMAVFGVPTLHEDDALRATRAAIELREQLASLNDELESTYGVRLETRTGINTGEVVVGEGETLVTGDAVNVAARFQQAGGPGEIIVGEATYGLVRDAVEAEPVEELPLKGKSAPTHAVRLIRVLPGRAGLARRLDLPLVGRDRELRLLEAVADQAIAGSSCHLVTVLGSAGIGKTRLVDELLSRAGESVRVLRGRCLAYGEGITYWPLLEALREAAGIDGETPREAALERLEDLAAGAEQARLIAARVAELVGLADGSTTAEDGQWATRKLLERLAHERPLIFVLDDVHWAEPALLELVEHIADWSRDAPILLLCLSRPELLESQPGWGGGKLNATSLLLQPLDDTECEALIANLLGGHVPEALVLRLTSAADGNPLYLEELLQMLVAGGTLRRSNGGWATTNGADEFVAPPTIHALLASRLDTLPADERMTLACAAVEGKLFHAGAVVALSASDDARGRLGALVRTELIRPAVSAFGGDEAFEFHHQLVRDAAYELLPKRTRAELHERFAAWLEPRTASRSDIDEILGYHLEQAHRYHVELGPPDDAAIELGRRAATLLTAAGARAAERDDQRAARRLLERALALPSPDASNRLELMRMLGLALVGTGDLGRGTALLGDAAAEARSERNELAEARVRVALLEALSMANPEQFQRETEWLESEAVPLLERAGDDLALARAWRTLSVRRWGLLSTEAATASAERGAAHARRAGARGLELSNLSWVFLGLFYGPTRAELALQRCDRAVAEADGEPRALLAVLNARAGLRAYRGRFDEARDDLRRYLAISEDLGREVWSAVVESHIGGTIESLAGNDVAAEAIHRRAYARLSASGEKAHFSTTAWYLGETVYRLGRLDEAEAMARDAEEAASSDDIATQAGWRQLRAKILARRGLHEQAERLAREALALIEPTDWLVSRGEAFLSLAEVLRARGATGDSASSLGRALDLFERKGDLVDAARVRRLLGSSARPS